MSAFLSEEYDVVVADETRAQKRLKVSEQIRQRIAGTRIIALADKKPPKSAAAEKLLENIRANRDAAWAREYVQVPSPAYSIFTREYDEVVTASDLSDEDELMRLYGYIDQQAEPYHGLSRALSGAMREVFCTINEIDPRDTVVSILTDNSGGQRYAPMLATAILTDMLAVKLELLGVKTEVLGHTTRAWKGGQSRDKWLKYGKSPSPGRLNDIRYVVYKDTDHKWKDVRPNIGLMAREGFVKENIDGEALQWAASRLEKIPAKRRVLVYIGKMQPMDDSTMSVNPDGLLASHLRSVATQIVADRKVELRGIHIGHGPKMTALFPHCEDVGQAGEVLLERPATEIAQRLSGLFMQWG